MSDPALVRRAARALRRAQDLDPLLERIGDARLVLLGEASHGTHEFYTWRAAITRRLIAERGFGFVAVECGAVPLRHRGRRRPRPHRRRHCRRFRASC